MREESLLDGELLMQEFPKACSVVSGESPLGYGMKRTLPTEQYKEFV